MVSDDIQSMAVDSISDDLFNYSIDKHEIKLILDALPEVTNGDRNVLEYELQLLRILFVGWGISFFMFGRSEKQFVLETFWKKVSSFSDELSLVISLAVGDNINYFNVLKRRINTYVSSLNSADPKLDTMVIIGSVFATTCNMENNACAILVGSKVFNLTISAVKEYLNCIFVGNYVT